MALSGPQWPSVVIRVHQWSSVAIIAQSEAISGHQWPSRAIRSPPAHLSLLGELLLLLLERTLHLEALLWGKERGRRGERLHASSQGAPSGDVRAGGRPRRRAGAPRHSGRAQWPSEAIRGHQWPSVAISGHQSSPVLLGTLGALSGHQWPSVVISGHQSSSVAISGHQWPSVAIRGHQWSSVAISGHQWSSVAISGHQWSSEFISAPRHSGRARRPRRHMRRRAGAPDREWTRRRERLYAGRWLAIGRAGAPARPTAQPAQPPASHAR